VLSSVDVAGNYREVALLVTVLALGKERVVQEVEMMLALVHLKERQCGRD